MSETSNDTDKNDASVVSIIDKNLENLNETEENCESALEKPAENVAKNVVESIDPTFIQNKELLSKYFVEYKEIRETTLRSKEHMETRLAQLESDLIEDVCLEDISADLKGLHAGIDNVRIASDKVIEEYERGTWAKISKSVQENFQFRAGETDKYVFELYQRLVYDEELENTAISFKKRIAVIQANQELALKLKDKLDLVDAFLQKASKVIENEAVPRNSDELESSIQEHDSLLNEFNQVQVQNSLLFLFEF